MSDSSSAGPLYDTVKELLAFCEHVETKWLLPGKERWSKRQGEREREEERRRKKQILS